MSSENSTRSFSEHSGPISRPIRGEENNHVKGAGMLIPPPFFFFIEISPQFVTSFAKQPYFDSCTPTVSITSHLFSDSFLSANFSTNQGEEMKHMKGAGALAAQTRNIMANDKTRATAALLSTKGRASAVQVRFKTKGYL